MTKRYQTISRAEMSRLYRNYAIALPVTLLSGTALYFGAAALINAGYVVEGTSAMCLSAAVQTLAINLGHRLRLLWLERLERSMP